MLRCFIASFVPRAALDALGAFELPPRARAVVAGNLHVTLRFLGQIDAAAARGWAAQVVAARHALPVECTVTQLDGFPNNQRATALVARVASNGVLEALAQSFGAENFKAHVTLGRAARGGVPFPSVDVARGPSFLLTDLDLYVSETLQTGARYRRFGVADDDRAVPPPSTLD